jgi:hypothetical protein
LGLLATSTTGYSAFGARFLNATATSLDLLSVQATGEVWRQSDKPKTITCYYYIDAEGTNGFSTNHTDYLPGLDVAFNPVPQDIGGVAVDGTSPLNQVALSAINQPITTWAPGAALWLVWEMADPTGKAQGLAIDNLTFSAAKQEAINSLPLAIAVSAGQMILSWPASAGQDYQLEYKEELTDPAWTPMLDTPLPGTGLTLSLTNSLPAANQRFFRLSIVP